ncbi:MAG: restriction endonuclease subunit S [Selenomonadaceae bacterium]|nr:restriction endonuclease subunit S [Selenomonadaceae bacterium]
MIEYKITPAAWIKKIPAHWNFNLVREIFEERKTKVSDKIYPPLSVSKAGVVPQMETAAKTDNGDNRKLVKIGDFVINSRSDRKGSSGISDYEGSVSLIYTVLKPSINVNKKFLHYLLRSVPFTEEYYRNGKGLVSDLWTTNYDKFRNIFIPIPPCDEQEKIVRYLDKKTSQIAMYIDAKKKEVELLGELKRSIISDAVTKGLHSSQTPTHWKKIKLKYIAKLNPDRKKSFLPTDKLGYVPMECVKSGYLIPKEILFKDLISGLTYFENGDIILAKVTPCFENGNIAIAKNLTNGKAYGSSELFVLKCFNVKTKFLFYLLQSNDFKNDCIASMTGVAGLKRVSSRTLMNYLISLPLPEEQKEISNFLDAKCAKIEKLIETLQNEIKFVEELMTRIISDVVTGKIDVRELI